MNLEEIFLKEIVFIFLVEDDVKIIVPQQKYVNVIIKYLPKYTRDLDGGKHLDITKYVVKPTETQKDEKGGFMSSLTGMIGKSDIMKGVAKRKVKEALKNNVLQLLNVKDKNLVSLVQYDFIEKNIELFDEIGVLNIEKIIELCAEIM